MIARLRGALPCALTFLCAGVALAQRSQEAQPAAVVTAPASISVERINVIPRPDGLTIKIALSAPVSPETNQVTNPNRLIFDFPGCQLKGGNRHIPVNHGPVKELRVSLYSIQPPVTRVVVASKQPLAFEAKPATNGTLVIKIPFAKLVASPAATPPSPAATAPATVPAPVASAPATASAPYSAQAQRAVEETPTRPALPPQKEPEPQTGAPAKAQPGAYSLMARAKALSVGDLEALEHGAAAGDPQAQTMLALAYHAGVLLRQDDAEAVRLLRQAADHGAVAAEESLGIFSETGIGMPPAPTDALQWYEKAAQHGSLDAATNIALMYANGKGVERDSSRALAWFRRAAEGGDASAQYNLALMYDRGEGVPQDHKEAVRWLNKAADRNLVPAILDLGEVFLRPPNSTIAADVAKAVEYYEKAANLGNPLAQSILGTIFAKGLQGKMDYEQSVKWFRMAADQGDPDGEVGLGVSYAMGHGVPVDYEEARRLITAAAGQGNVEAQYDLAVMSEEGNGAPPDRDMAAHYYELAAQRGMAKAQYRHGLLLAKSSASRSNRIAAYKWLMLAQGSIKESLPALSDLRKAMNDQEIAEAEREVDDWRLAHKHDEH